MRTADGGRKDERKDPPGGSRCDGVARARGVAVEGESRGWAEKVGGGRVEALVARMKGAEGLGEHPGFPAWGAGGRDRDPIQRDEPSRDRDPLPLGRGGRGEDVPCEHTKLEVTVSPSHGGAGPSECKCGAEKSPARRWTFGNMNGMWTWGCHTIPLSAS